MKKNDGLLVHQDSISLFYFVAICNPAYFLDDLLVPSLLLDAFAVVAHVVFCEPSMHLKPSA